jgi:hypothetical protein
MIAMNTTHTALKLFSSRAWQHALLACALLGGAAVSQAQSLVSLSAVPTAWRLENYVAGGVVLWYTGSTCTNGNLSLPANSVKADHDRLYATISLAKAVGKKAFVYYTNNGTSCLIASFGMLEE